MAERTKPEKNKNNYNWFYAILPVNVAFGPITTFIALYILDLGGNVIEVSTIITLGYLILIPASFFWGRVNDSYTKRKTLLVLSYVGMALSFAGMFFVSSITYLTAFYMLLFFFNTANTIPLSILTMSMVPKRKWVESFSEYQLMLSIGTAIGLIIASIVAGFINIKYLILIFSGFSMLSAILSYKYLKETNVTSNTNFPKVILSAILQFIIWPISFIRPSKYISFIRSLKNKGRDKAKQHYLFILIAASFVFFFGSGLFNTIYAAGLKQYGLKSYMVFLIFFVTQIIQIAAFMKSARYIKNRPKDQISSKFLIIRGSAYIAIGAIFAFAFVINLYFAYFNLLFYLIGAGVAYAFYYIASNTLFFEAIKGMDRGKSLGVYSAITSIGLFVGSYVSGYIAYLIGYADVFFIAGALMFASAAMFMFLSKKKIVAVLA